MSTNPTRAALYARVSTTNHGQDVGLQLDEQRGWDVVGVYENSGISGTERSCPALDRLVADCKAGMVVVWKLDRLARSVVHTCCCRSVAASAPAWLASRSMAFHLDEPLGIDPCVDVAFLWLFGGEGHEHIRVDFLNAVLAPDVRIARTRVMNPVHPSVRRAVLPAARPSG